MKKRLAYNNSFSLSVVELDIKLRFDFSVGFGKLKTKNPPFAK